jgi:uncharacterized membrane protein YcaP (DUF421 family)
MDIIIRAAAIYLFVYLLLRALGKRELGELTAFELVLLFVVGDLVQQSITQNDTSLTAAVLAIGTISMLILAQSYAVFRWRRSRPVLEGRPVVLLLDGRPIEGALHSERMTVDDLENSARAEGIANLADVRIAILEIDGKVSFITRGEDRPVSKQSRIAD